MKVYRAHKTELAPNDRQRTAFLRAAGCARWAYNWGLRRKIEAFEARKAALAAGISPEQAPEVPNAMALHKGLNALKKLPVEQGGVPWMYEVSKSAPQEALRNLDKAFDNFFRRCKAGGNGAKGFPRFKSRKQGVGGFSLPLAAPDGDAHVALPRVGKVRTKERGYLPTEGVKVLGATVTERAGRWFVSVRTEADIPDPEAPQHLPSIGVDVGIKSLAVCSDGSVFENPKALRKATARLRLLQQAVSRKVKGSNNRKKANAKVARLHYRISCVRQDALHKASDAITKRASVVVLEDLNVAGMTKNRKLARAVSDASISELHRQIRYKAAWRGVRIVTADRWFPSSKTCSACGVVKDKLGLDEREFVCDDCGFTSDRDANAAVNLKHLAVSSTVTACRPGSSGEGRKTCAKLLVGQEPNSELGLSLLGSV